MMASTSFGDPPRRTSACDSPSSSVIAPNSNSRRFSEPENIHRPYSTPSRANDLLSQSSHGMLELRSIVLADGLLRNYYALPPDYENINCMPPRLSYRYELPPPFPVNQTDDGIRILENKNRVGKRKFVDDEECNRSDFRMQRQQLMHRGKEIDARSELEEPAETQTSPVRGVREGNVSGRNQNDFDQKVKRAFVHYIKMIFGNMKFKKKYLSDGKQGPLRCLPCHRTSAVFADVHSLSMHAYNAYTKDSKADHLAFLKTLCILMGWNSAVPPNNSKAYQKFSSKEAESIREDLILWPPTVVIYTTPFVTEDEKVSFSKEGIGNLSLDALLKDAGFGAYKSTSVYSKELYMVVNIIEFPEDEAGLREALRMSNHFKKEKHLEKNAKRPKQQQPVVAKFKVYDGHLSNVSDLATLVLGYKKRFSVKSMKEFLQDQGK